MSVTDTKTCTRCGEPVTRPMGLSRARWAQRTTCGYRCEAPETNGADTKPCVVCGTTITRTGQNDRDWEIRAYCSRKCIWAMRKTNGTRVPDTKPCQACGKRFARPRRTSTAQWEARRHCSTKCRRGETGHCEVCGHALPAARKSSLPWCSGPCKTKWLTDNPEPAREQRTNENTEPPVRIRSDLLPADTPRKTWIDRTPGRIAVCCGHCRRRFPRGSVRLAERLLTLHRRTCGSGL